MAPQKTKKELQPFLGMLKYLCKFLPMMAEVYDPLWKLASLKPGQTWNRMYQDLYNKVKEIVMKDACMKLCDVVRPLYLETNSSSIYWPCSQANTGKGWSELQACQNTRECNTESDCISQQKCLSSAQWCYSKIECEALRILHKLEKYQYYYSTM